MDGGMIMSNYSKWYNLGYGKSAVNLEELNKHYCMEFYNIFGKLPKPNNLTRPVLINEIRKLQQIAVKTNAPPLT